MFESKQVKEKLPFPIGQRYASVVTKCLKRNIFNDKNGDEQSVEYHDYYPQKTASTNESYSFS
jgi:hypothetical protein